MEPITYTVEMEPLETGGFSVRVPALPGCVTWGTTFENAVAMAREAIELWLEVRQELGEPIPEEPEAPFPVKLGVRVRRPTVA
jgi:predicted RNase H-like HicB family nuclease